MRTTPRELLAALLALVVSKAAFAVAVRIGLTGGTALADQLHTSGGPDALGTGGLVLIGISILAMAAIGLLALASLVSIVRRIVTDNAEVPDNDREP